MARFQVRSRRQLLGYVETPDVHTAVLKVRYQTVQVVKVWFKDGGFNFSAICFPSSGASLAGHCGKCRI